MNSKFLSDVGFYLLLAVTRVRLLHALAVGTELAGVHAAVWLTVWLLHLLQGSLSLGHSASMGWHKEMCFQPASPARTRSLLLGLPDTVQPLLLVEGVIGLESVSLALGSIFEADSKEVFDWKKQYISNPWMLWLNGFYNQRVYLSNRICNHVRPKRRVWLSPCFTEKPQTLLVTSYCWIK